ncbi:hypothetical protein ACS0TY_014383 [Phlomoides rotata]
MMRTYPSHLSSSPVNLIQQLTEQPLMNTPPLTLTILNKYSSSNPISTQSSMASLLTFLLLLTIFISATTAQTHGLVLPLRKDSKTSQFYTTFQMGSHRAAINAVIHLGGQHLWIDCDNYTSDTYAPIPCDSPKCELAEGIGCIGCNGPTRPGCTNNTCGTASSNPFIFYITSRGLFEDTLISRDNVELSQFMFSCVNNDYLAGLASGAAGMLGLSRFVISVHKQVAEKMNVPDKFSICAPSFGIGKLSIGIDQLNISGLLKTTPLLVNKPGENQPISTPNDLSEEYFIGVKSIRVAGEPVSVKESYFSISKDRTGGTKISTVQNFTALHSSIYKPLTRAFDKATANMKIRSAAAVAPFRACYRSESIVRTPAGPEVPAIDLILPGNDVYWRINGANSMVEIDQKTMCLAFVDAGSRARTSVVIGAHQMEENFLEFDLVSAQLKFSSSLRVQNMSCSRLQF